MRLEATSHHDGLRTMALSLSGYDVCLIRSLTRHCVENSTMPFRFRRVDDPSRPALAPAPQTFGDADVDDLPADLATTHCAANRCACASMTSTSESKLSADLRQPSLSVFSSPLWCASDKIFRVPAATDIDASCVGERRWSAEQELASVIPVMRGRYCILTGI